MFSPLFLRRTGAVALVSAQSGAQREPPVFRASTRLVEFAAIVLDKKGNPLTDLRKEDFAVFDNGAKQEIAFFRHEGTPEPDVEPKVAPAGLFSNRTEYSSGPQRHVTAPASAGIASEPPSPCWRPWASTSRASLAARP